MADRPTVVVMFHSKLKIPTSWWCWRKSVFIHWKPRMLHNNQLNYFTLDHSGGLTDHKHWLFWKYLFQKADDRDSCEGRFSKEKAKHSSPSFCQPLIPLRSWEAARCGVGHVTKYLWFECLVQRDLRCEFTTRVVFFETAEALYPPPFCSLSVPTGCFDPHSLTHATRFNNFLLSSSTGSYTREFS